MLLKNLLITVAFLVTAVSPSALRADNKLIHRVITKRVTPKPSTDVFEAWVQDFFNTDELWRVENKETYEALIDANISDVKLKDKLKRLYKDDLTSEQFIKASTFYRANGKDGFVIIPKNLRAQIPRSMIESIYSREFEVHRHFPRLSLSKPSLKEIEAYLANNFSPSAQRILRENVIHLNGKFLLLVTPHTWELFPDYLRRKIIDHTISPVLAREGVAAKIVVHRGDSLVDIAQKYAGERDPRPIERYLRMALGSSESVEIELEKLMHPFIRKMIDSYSVCDGPNCFNSGLNVNRLRGHKLEHIDAETRLLKNIYLNYRFVRPEETLQAGDLLVYRDVKGEVVHVSSYVADNIVFTKNGLSKLNPYIFQEISANEQVYFPDRMFQLSVFRVPSPGEPAINRTGRYQGAQVYFRQHPNLERKEWLRKNCPTALLPGELSRILSEIKGF